MEEFEKEKARELATIQEAKDKEAKRLKQEKKTLDKQAKAVQIVSNKKEKEEIESLKKENSKLREDIKAKEIRYKHSVEKMKKDIDELALKNQELEALIKSIPSKKTEPEVKKLSTKKNTKMEEKTKTEKPKVIKEAVKEIPDQQDIIEADNQDNLNDAKPEEKDQLADEKPNLEEENKKPEEGSQEIVEENYEMVFPQKYHAKNIKLVSQRVFNDGKVNRLYENGKTEITFNNGVKREIFPDGYTVVYFNNKDIKQVYKYIIKNRLILIVKSFIILQKLKPLKQHFLMACKFLDLNLGRSRNTIQMEQKKLVFLMAH